MVGLGEGEHFLASDIPALLPYTRDFLFLEDGDVVDGHAAAASASSTLAGAAVSREPQRIAWDPVQAEKGGYRHFMLKEIHEQPRACATRSSAGSASRRARSTSRSSGAAASALREAERVVLLACGTSWHAALVGKFLIEQLAGIPAEVDYGSEFRYRDPARRARHAGGRDQPERRDRGHPGRVPRGARRRGALPLAICNVQGSMLTREAAGIAPHPRRARDRRRLDQGLHRPARGARAARAAPRPAARDARPPRPAASTSPSLDPHPAPDGAGARARARRSRSSRARSSHARDFLYLGRGVNYPIALEGALKLKEISYIHAEGYPAGEMKHGPIALIDEELPVVALCPRGRVYEKMLSNIQEVKARGGRVIAVAAAGDAALRAAASTPGDALLEIPRCRRAVVAAPHRAPAAAARLPRGRARRARRGPAAQPRQVGHRRVGAAS